MATNDRVKLRKELETKILQSAELQAGTKSFADQVKQYAQKIAPVDEGEFAASIHVKRVRTRRGAAPHYWVGSKHWRAHMIEFGTKADPPDSKSPFGPNTPTPEFGVFAKTAAHFGGTVEGGIEGGEQ